MKMFACFRHAGLSLTGGVETCYLRMYEWAKSKGYSLKFFLHEDAEIGEEWLSYMNKLEISIFTYVNHRKKIKKNGCYVSSFQDYNLVESLCITDSIISFSMANDIFKKEDVKILYYVLHPYSTKLCNRRVINILWAKPIIKSIKDTHLIFMDEETRRYSDEYYSDIDFSRTNVVRLGLQVPPFDLNERKRTYQKAKFTIITVSRFDFPFKGYVCGLIDTYIKLKEVYSNIELIIIGDGEGRKVIEEKIKKLPGNIGLDINLVGHLEYSSIGKYMKNANLFVGMGTTVLDAAKYGVPGIIATAYQMDDYSSGFFVSDYTCLGKLIDEIGANRFHFRELIEQVYMMKEEAYLKFSKQNYDVLIQNYGLDKAMYQMFNIDGEKRVAIPRGIYFFYEIMLPLWTRCHKEK